MNLRHHAILGLTSALAMVGITAAASFVGQAGAELQSPIRLTQMNNRHLLIADYFQQRIVECRANAELTELMSFPIEGRPLAVAFLQNRIFVGNETTQRVEIFSREGQKLSDLGGVDGDIQKPTDMAVDKRLHYVFVVDGLGAKVKIFDVSSDPSGVLVGTIPPAGSTTSSLIHPTGIALNPDTGEVFVSDFGDPNIFAHPSVMVFDYQGNLTNTISGRTGLLGQRFSRPQGLAVRGDHLFLVDSWMGRVFILDRQTGVGLGELGTFGSGPGQLNLPLDIVLDRRSDDVFVTNYQNKRVERFPKGAVVQ